MIFFQAIKMSCRDATYLHGKQKEGELSFTEALGLKIHLLFCSLCRLFFKQLDKLEEQAHIFSHTHESNATLDMATKEKMKQALQEELKK